MAEAPGLVAGVDDVCLVGDAVDDGFGEAGVGEDLGPFAEGQVGGDDQAAAFVALADDLEDELGGAFGQVQVSELVKDHQLGAGVAADDPGEFAAAVGFLQLVGEAGEGGEADAAALLAGADREAGGEHRLAGAALADEHDRLAVVDPGALGQGGDRGLGHLGVIVEAEVLEPFDDREPGVDQPALFAAFGALGDLGLKQRGEVGERGLLLARCLGGELPEPG